MTHPAARVLAMLELLQAHRRMSGAELAERLAVDERTVRRYAGTLADLGIPVRAERGRYGGYRLAPGFKLPPLMLTDDEALAVVLGLMAADRIGLSTETPAAASAEAKITRVLPLVLADRLAALRASLGFTAGVGERDSPDADTLLTLGAAARAHERVTITYRARAQPASTRDLDPYGLVFHSGRWYVVGHDHRSDEIRSFRVDRIAGLERAGRGFEVPPGFDAVDHLNRQWATLPYRWEVEVLVEADLAAVRRRVPPSVADLTQESGAVRMRCRAQDLTGMAQMVAGLGWPVTVVRPDQLRGALADYAAQLVRWSQRAAPTG